MALIIESSTITRIIVLTAALVLVKNTNTNPSFAARIETETPPTLKFYGRRAQPG
jgi:hypothetical protein